MVLPLWLQGVLLRRPTAMALAARWDLDGKAVQFMQRLRRRYGEAPLAIRKPGQPQVLLLAAGDVARVLDGAPQPFMPASAAKRAALSHFEPHVSLISRGDARAPRRQLSDEVLQSAAPVHDMAQRFAAVVRDEAQRLLSGLREGDDMTWPLFTDAWYSAARRIVLGERARNDRELTDMLRRLRAAANWVYLLPVRQNLRARYYQRLEAHLRRAEPGSLAALIARHSDRRGADAPRREANEAPGDQVTQWLFAFDGGGIAVFRTLALLRSHADQATAAEPEIAAWRNGQQDLPFLRAAFVETLRLWPTTPAILREVGEATTLGGTTLAKGTGVIIYAPFFHRDSERLANADRFEPAAWLYKDPAQMAPLVPFSAGPAACPGRHLVSLLAGMWLAALLDGGRLQLVHPALPPDTPLSGTFDFFSIRFRVVR
jgi:cytochrome P450